MTRIERYDNPLQFAADCRDFLMQDLRARDRSYVLINSACRSAEAGHRLLYRVVEHDQTVGVALIVTRPPIRRLMLDLVDANHVPALVDTMRSDVPSLTSVMGNLPVAQPFAHAWGEHQIHSHMGCLALASGPHVPTAAGHFRPATLADTDLLHAWLTAFIIDCRLNENLADLPRIIAERLAAPEPIYWLWEVDGEPVSLCARNGDANVTRIGAVYTPPDQRGRSYAGSLVARLCTQLRAQGVREICLTTDLSNPTSNALYHRIGFERFGESVELVFE